VLTCLLVGLGLAFAFSERAEAGYGVHPNGDSFAVTTDSSGYIESPKTLDFVVYLDGQDSSAYVWISESPTISTYGTPVGSSVGGCSQGELIPFGEPNKWVCRDSTILLKPGRTYYWWLDFRRLEPGQAFAEDRISGPFSFTLTQAVPPPVPTPPPAVEPTPVPTYTPPVSTKTSKSAATLPSADVFDRGGRSIKHARLTKLVYETMKGIGLPRTLAIACWNPLDWQSVVESEGGQTQDGDSVLLGFWLPWQPRWLHIAPNVCRDVQGLLSTRLLNERRAYAVTTVLHLASGPSGSGRILRSCRASTASRR
jgi:hypothetical protein